MRGESQKSLAVKKSAAKARSAISSAMFGLPRTFFKKAAEKITQFSAARDKTKMDYNAILPPNSELVLMQGGPQSSWQWRESVVVKQFPRRRARRANRSFKAAELLHARGVAVAQPLALIERREHVFLLNRFIPELTDFRKIVLAGGDYLWAVDEVASAVRAMHDAGCFHGDLGNQNIGFAAEKVVFLDLDRAILRPSLGIILRARELSRVTLPADLLERLFMNYWRGAIPRGFCFWERFFRGIFTFHTATRRFRHPIREARYRRHPENAPVDAKYPFL